MINAAVAPLVPFTSTEKLEAIIIVVTSCISTAAIFFTFLRVTIAALGSGKKNSKAAIFFKTQLGYYAAALLSVNLVGALSGVVEVAWVGKGGIINNSLCSTQATLIQIGNFGSAYFTTVTAIHTFNALVLKSHPRIWMSIIIILIGIGASLSVGLAVPLVMDSTHGSFYGDIGLFCFVSDGYTVAQFIATFIPIIVAAFTSSLLYAVIYLCMRGTLEFKQGIKINMSEELTLNRLYGKEEYRRFVGAVVKSMLWYPFSYTILLLPLTIVGLMTISGIDFPAGLLAFGIIFASLQGTANVLILNRTLNVLRPVFSTPAESVKTGSFFVAEERKVSPIEAPNPPITFSPARAFPPPTSRSSSPMNRSVSGSLTPSAYRPYARSLSSVLSPTSSSEDLTRPPVSAPLLKHYRSETSNLSITSMTELLAPEHRRTPSNSLSEDGLTAEGSVSTLAAAPPASNAYVSAGPSLVEPIAKAAELPKTKLVVRNPSNSLPTSPRSGYKLSPAPSVRVSPAPSAGLSPPPRRPGRSTVLRESLLNTFASMQAAIESQAPHPQSRYSAAATPEFLNVDPMSAPAVPGRSEQRMSSINDARSIYSFYEHQNSSDEEQQIAHVDTQEYNPYSEYSEDEFEIRTVDSRTTVQPSISAVAGKIPLSLTPGRSSLQMRRKSSRRRRKASASEDVILEAENEDAVKTEPTAAAARIPPPRQDSVTKDQANLSKLAWASLVTSAAFASNAERPTPVDIPVEERDWRADSVSPASASTERGARMSGIPMSLRPGTPRTAPADGSFAFLIPSPSTMPQGGVSSSGVMFRPEGSQDSQFVGRVVKSQRSFNVDRRPNVRRGPSTALSIARSDTASPAFL